MVAKFDDFFKVRKNVIFERANFNRRNQLPGESAEKYITVLYQLVETCEYGEFQQQMLRDRLVVGMKDTAFSERLQMNPDLTLDKVKRELRQKEAVREQQQQLQTETPTRSETLEAVDSVSGRRPVPERSRGRWRTGGGGNVSIRTNHNPIKGGATDNASGHQQQLCKRCGKPRHIAGARCPAKVGDLSQMW